MSRFLKTTNKIINEFKIIDDKNVLIPIDRSFTQDL